jgi:polyketide cyclase/dehydrase/lipid transport protein
MRRHEFTIDLPHSARRLWALFRRYDLWKEFAPSVLDVEIVWPGDAAGNGLLRRVVYPLPFGRRGESFELVKNVRADAGYDYVMLRTGLSGSMSLERLGPNRTRLRFREAFDLQTPVLRWFEGPIYRYINSKNEASMRGASAWLAAHPEFHPDLVDREDSPGLGRVRDGPST